MTMRLSCCVFDNHGHFVQGQSTGPEWAGSDWNSDIGFLPSTGLMSDLQVG